MPSLLEQVPEGQCHHLSWGKTTDKEYDLVHKTGIGMIFLKIKISPF